MVHELGLFEELDPVLITSTGFIPISVSAAMCRLLFTPCGPECLAAGCRGNCCDAPSLPTGCMITIHPSEQNRIEARGGVVVDSFLQPESGMRGCPFKKDGLCSLHFTPDKPFGCIASPFTLNSKDTLIVRNRYKMLPCYRGNGKKIPAYKAFVSSLVLLFGEENTDKLTKHLDAGGGNLIMLMPAENYTRLKDNDAVKKRAMHGKV